MLDPELAEILACPVTGGPLVFDAARGVLVSTGAGLVFPIIGGIPVLVPPQESLRVSGAAQ